MRRSARPRLCPLPALIGLALTGCLADPAPTPCRVNRDCPADAPWCVRSACAAEVAEYPDTGPTPARDPCAVPDERRCPDSCAWLTACIEGACSRAVAVNPELLDAVAESCLTQCRVDVYVGDELCRLTEDDRCGDAVEGLRQLLGFEICSAR